ncbi:MAG: protein kinase [Acidobacteriota bacterium]
MQKNDDEQNNFLLDEQIVGNYKIIRQLGRGAMGSVYLAEQIHVGRRLVALKVLNRECASNPQVIKRFESEAASAGLIHHRNVVTIYESRMTGSGHLFVAMEYVHGRSLRQELQQRGTLPLDEVIEVAKQICAGLAAAHKVGIVHRDIKPDNLMLVQDEETEGLTVKILDFGIARLSESNAMSMQTQPGLIIGTPAYLSPEQAAGAIGSQIDSRADIYSLGMVIYEMLTGKVAFASDSWMSVVRQQIYDQPPTPNHARPGLNLPAAIEQIVMRTLEKERENRPQSAAILARELDQAHLEFKQSPTLRELPSGSQTVSIPPSQQSVQSPARASVQANPQATAQISAISESGVAAPTGARTAGGSLSGKWITGAVFVALALVAVFWWWSSSQGKKQLTEAPTVVATPSPFTAAIKRDVLSYRIVRKTPVSGLLTLPVDRTVKTNERILFEFQPRQAGRLYLMMENSDHSWRWFNAAKDGRGTAIAANGKIELPSDKWYVLDDNAGVEKFWLFYVPDGMNWSLAESLAPASIRIESAGKWTGTSEIRAEAAEKILGWFKSTGAELKAASQQNDRQVLVQLWQQTAGNHPDDSLPAYHLIELNHIQ